MGGSESQKVPFSGKDMGAVGGVVGWAVLLLVGFLAGGQGGEQARCGGSVGGTHKARSPVCTIQESCLVVVSNGSI